MKLKKEFMYNLKKDVRDDLEFLNLRISCLLRYDEEGFVNLEYWSVFLDLFKVFSHLVWNCNFVTWFKKVYIVY